MHDPNTLEQFGLPAIESIGELGLLFGISIDELKWLSGYSGHQNRFSHGHYGIHVHRKRSGLPRLIESPKSKLKQIQREILHDIAAAIPVHPAAHGFCPGKSVLTFAEPHVGKASILKMDLRDFFPSITGARVRGVLKKFGYSSEIAGILADLCVNTVSHSELDRLTSEFSQPVRSRLHHFFSQPHLPQGAPTSPHFANLCAFRFDLRLSKLAEKMNYHYTRYADDLVFSVANGRISRSFGKIVAEIAFEENFEINFHKTRLLTESNRQKIVGVVVNQKINIARNEFDRLKAILHNCRRSGLESQNMPGVDNFREHLRGRIAWISQVNKNRGERLLCIFDAIDWHH